MTKAALLKFAVPNTSKLKRASNTESYLLGRVEARAALRGVSCLADVDGRMVTEAKVSFAEFDALFGSLLVAHEVADSCHSQINSN